MERAFIVLEEVLDSAQASSLHEKLLQARGHDLAVDASRVEHLGGLCTQLVLSAISTWRHDGAQLQVLNPSEKFRESVRLFGLDEYIACEVSCP